MANIKLTLAIGPYDHVRDFVDGTVRAKGIDITALNLSIEEIFYRFTRFREWDISELSFGKYVSLVSQNDASITAIPVFPSRVFRHSSIYIRKNGGIGKPQDLKDKRVGIPEWAQTAAIYTRGYLAHEAGVALKAIEWHQAGVNEAGRAEKVKLKLPKGVRYVSHSDRSLNDMLLAGELDAVLSARPPRAALEPGSRMTRLFPDALEVEKAYYRKTGIFPIMHVVALRREVLDRHPWVAMNLYTAFEEAKRRSLQRALDVTASYYPLPWTVDYARQSQAMFGDDFWPYGIEGNRATLESFLQFAYEQGVCHRKLAPEDLFPAEVQSSYRV